MLYWMLKSVVLGPVLRLLFRPRVEGRRNVPATGPAILASNHLSFSDSIFLPLVLDRRITFPAKMEYFTGTGITGRLKAMFFSATGQIPIDRTGGSASRAAIDAGLEVLARGELFGIYPEGTRSPDGRLYRGKTGVARMAIEAGVPIIPVAMIDTDKAQPTGQKIPNITRVGVRFGRPIETSAYAGQQDDHEVLRAITDEVMRSVQELSGQEYVDEYAATRKAAIAARAEALLAAAKTESAAAAARAEELVAAAKAESERARIKAEDIMASARAETANARVRAEDLVATARAETTSAIGRAEDLVAAAKARARAKREEREESVVATEPVVALEPLATPDPQGAEPVATPDPQAAESAALIEQQPPPWDVPPEPGPERTPATKAPTTEARTTEARTTEARTTTLHRES